MGIIIHHIVNHLQGQGIRRIFMQFPLEKPAFRPGTEAVPAQQKAGWVSLSRLPDKKEGGRKPQHTQYTKG